MNILHHFSMNILHHFSIKLRKQIFDIHNVYFNGELRTKSAIEPHVFQNHHHDMETLYSLLTICGVIPLAIGGFEMAITLMGHPCNALGMYLQNCWFGLYKQR